MTELVPRDNVPDDEAALLAHLVGIVEEGRRVAAVRVNATLTMTYWLVGHAISVNTLATAAPTTGSRFWRHCRQNWEPDSARAFEQSNLARMVRFARQFPDYAQVCALAGQLSWSRVVDLLALKSEEAQAFYAEEAATKRLSVRELRTAISRNAYERRKIANSQIPEGSAVPRDTFRDPLILVTLGLHDSYLEKDLPAAILRDVQAFLLEVGDGFAFVASQKRMVVDGEDFYLDLLFFSRPLRRLVAVELKIGKIDARLEGQMKLYLKWLDRYDRQPGEEAPIGLILCTEVSREQVELLEIRTASWCPSTGPLCHPRPSWRPSSERLCAMPRSASPAAAFPPGPRRDVGVR